MSRREKIVLAVLVALIAMQFLRPARNTSAQVLSTDITKLYAVPDSIQFLLKEACYDCHSNNTNYPWYTNLQPFGWLLAHHIKEGKAELNFSEFGSYSERKQRSKMQSIAGSVEKDEMPLSSYTLMHPSARLSSNQKALLIDWAIKIKDSLSK